MITNEQYKIAILKYTSNGKKAVDLAMEVMSELNPVHFDSNEYHRILDGLVERGELIEIEYCLPNMEYKVKSFYLPKGSSITVEKI